MNYFKCLVLIGFLMSLMSCNSTPALDYAERVCVKSDYASVEKQIKTGISVGYDKAKLALNASGDIKTTNKLLKDLEGYTVQWEALLSRAKTSCLIHASCVYQKENVDDKKSCGGYYSEKIRDDKMIDELIKRLNATNIEIDKLPIKN
ncbi:hypothetical protein SG34_007100 [Thalassomonas viridans]|uniref:Lysozyme inhibitor LprI N-terminal domain-containing protein n=1 Tax=Thalassomonas viridans TaxID=137584 RepID=A0AAE9Z5J1_9GAMM|nr:hypothetical protein [Thalassomonas viridans]WDE06667.1 hypothetical protein SG34_007100 [Thalassomonas viridans]